MARGRCQIGTSGWSYKHWRRQFYPGAMSKGADQLRFYVERFDTVEVNGTFYRLIEAETFRRRCAPGPSASAPGPARSANVYCCFDNDDRGFAPQNALRLRALLNSGADTRSARKA